MLVRLLLLFAFVFIGCAPDVEFSEETEKEILAPKHQSVATTPKTSNTIYYQGEEYNVYKFSEDEALCFQEGGRVFIAKLKAANVVRIAEISSFAHSPMLMDLTGDGIPELLSSNEADADRFDSSYFLDLTFERELSDGSVEVAAGVSGVEDGNLKIFSLSNFGQIIFNERRDWGVFRTVNGRTEYYELVVDPINRRVTEYRTEFGSDHRVVSGFWKWNDSKSIFLRTDVPFESTQGQ